MRLAWTLFAGATLWTLVGCGSGEAPPPPTAPASGKVAFNGSPVTEGTVVLENPETGASGPAERHSDAASGAHLRCERCGHQRPVEAGGIVFASVTYASGPIRYAYTVILP